VDALGKRARTGSQTPDYGHGVSPWIGIGPAVVLLSARSVARDVTCMSAKLLCRWPANGQPRLSQCVADFALSHEIAPRISGKAARRAAARMLGGFLEQEPRRLRNGVAQD
jgi:hypothetical protein